MSERTVGLVFAMSAEAQSVTGCAQVTEQVVQFAGNVVLRVGGVGAVSAERSCAALVDAGARALVSVGIAAGLSPRCRPGAVVVPEQVRSAQGEFIASDAAWRAALVAALDQHFHLLPGHIAAVDRIIGSDDKRDLHVRTGAVAADMESAVVAEWARRTGLPMIALRVVSDGPGEDIPQTLLRAVDGFGRARYGPLLGALVSRPGDAAALWRLRKGFKTACDTLSRVVATTGPAFCCPASD